MESNDTIIIEPSALSHEDVLEEYSKISNLYLNLKTASEKDKQIIYELKRSIQTATAAESYLSSELETIASTHTKELNDMLQKNQSNFEDMKSKNSALSEANSNLEMKIEDLEKQVFDLNHNLEFQRTISTIPENSKFFDLERELKSEQNNAELMNLVEDIKAKLNVALELNLEYEFKLEILTEKLECLEDNLNTKKEELEEKSLQIENLQEKNLELNTELLHLKTVPQDQNRKGNSLFAEVDDQRQKMTKILLAQKQQFNEMKRLYNNGENEIRRLKRENASMHKEFRQCSSIFLNADRMFEGKLNERIQMLTKNNEYLEKKCLFAEENLIKLSTEKEIKWLNSILVFCKNETKDLKAQLYSCRMQKSLLEENLRSSQQDLAKWRFEAVNTRKILASRETLLEEHQVPFDPSKSVEYSVSKEDAGKETPRHYSIDVNYKSEELVVPRKVIIKTEDIQYDKDKKLNPICKDEQTKISVCVELKQENITSTDLEVAEVSCAITSPSIKANVPKSNINKQKVIKCETPKKKLTISPSSSLLSNSPKMSPRKSILIKEKDNIVKPDLQNDSKYVKFCESTIKKKQNPNSESEEKPKISKTKSNVTVNTYFIKSRPTKSFR